MRELLYLAYLLPADDRRLLDLCERHRPRVSARPQRRRLRLPALDLRKRRSTPRVLSATALPGALHVDAERCAGLERVVPQRLLLRPCPPHPREALERRGSARLCRAPLLLCVVHASRQRPELCPRRVERSGLCLRLRLCVGKQPRGLQLGLLELLGALLCARPGRLRSCEVLCQLCALLRGLPALPGGPAAARLELVGSVLGALGLGAQRCPALGFTGGGGLGFGNGTAEALEALGGGGGGRLGTLAAGGEGARLCGEALGAGLGKSVPVLELAAPGRGLVEAGGKRDGLALLGRGVLLRCEEALVCGGEGLLGGVVPLLRCAAGILECAQAAALLVDALLQCVGPLSEGSGAGLLVDTGARDALETGGSVHCCTVLCTNFLNNSCLLS